MSYTRHERLAYCDALAAAGADAPTLCAGWTAHDLAAHSVARERRPDASLGIVAAPLAGYTDSVRQRVKEQHSHPELVALLRQGAPWWSPLGEPGLGTLANTVEFFVHTEDVRRGAASWEPRALTAELQRMLWQRIPLLARATLRRAPTGIVAHSPDGRILHLRTARVVPTVTVTGPPSELLLFITGRQRAARVELDGHETAVRALSEATLGL